MKSYKEVVVNRYDMQVAEDFNSKTTLRWMPSQLKLCTALAEVLKKIDGEKCSLADARILEVGCGDGRWTRFISEITHKPELITGTDLSRNRIELARRMNPSINYDVADIVEESIEGTFDIILAFDVFMHLPTEAMIRTALNNIHESLSNDGVFIFFDAWAHSHSNPVANADSWGFNPKEITKLVESQGFTKLFRRDVFRLFPRGKHSERYYGVVPSWLLSTSEALCPTPPGNYFVVFGKEVEKK